MTQIDGTVDLIDAETLKRRGRVRALRGYAGAAVFSPDGRLLAVTGEGGQLTLWDARSLHPAGELIGLTSVSQALAFSPDGSLLAGAEGDPSYSTGSVRIWDVPRRALTGAHFDMKSASLAFSPDGKLLAAAGSDLPTEVRDPHSGRLVARLHTPDAGRSVGFSPDGRLLATGHLDGTAQLWSTRTWKPAGRPLEGHAAQRFLSVQFTPDGRVLATAGADGTVQLWDVAGQSPIGTPLTVERGAYVAATLSPDGARLFAVSDRHRGVRWDVAPEAWKRQACRLAGRDLTRQEWQDALPGQPYRTVCRTD